MANKNSNFPSNQLNQVNGQKFVGYTVDSLIELSRWGIPQNEQQLEQRFDSYFSYCISHDLRPGIESMCLALGISRQTFNNWISGKTTRSLEWINQCVLAKQICIAFLESASLSGHINPATSVFALKNWAGYSDNNLAVSLESERPRIQSIDDLPTFAHNYESEDNSNYEEKN